MDEDKLPPDLRAKLSQPEYPVEVVGIDLMVQPPQGADFRVTLTSGEVLCLRIPAPLVHDANTFFAIAASRFPAPSGPEDGTPH